jgi:hypothetical protein
MIRPILPHPTPCHPTSHPTQAGAWLLEDPDANYCYIADGANSQQQEILTQIHSRRNQATGKLESMALSMDHISDKSSEGQVLSSFLIWQYYYLLTF